jgi:hypothetical protein
MTDDTFWVSKLFGFRKAVRAWTALVTLDARSLTFAFKPVKTTRWA